MSREAKIGMLTGLLVIVLIGVLLSEYLGNTNTAGAGRSVASETYGENFRRQQREPLGVPGLIRDNTNTALVTANDTPTLPRAFATDAGGSAPGPVINTPAVPVDAGKADGTIAMVGKAADVAVTQEDLTGIAPGVTVGQRQAVYITSEQAREAGKADVRIAATQPVEKVEKVATTVPATRSEAYVIAKGDTLTLIAKKHYKSATPAQIKKIVAANRGTLKDETSGLIVGKTLMIPDVPAKRVEVAKGPEPKVEAGKVEFPLPVDTSKKALVVKPPAAEKVLDPKLFERVDEGRTVAASRPATTTYVVVERDTLERIARRISPKDYHSVMKAIKSANGLKDDGVLHVGQKLKVPAGSPGSGVVAAVY